MHKLLAKMIIDPKMIELPADVFRNIFFNCPRGVYRTIITSYASF